MNERQVALREGRKAEKAARNDWKGDSEKKGDDR